MSKVSIIVAIRNEASGIGSFLESFEKLRISMLENATEIQLILIEDGSTDNTNQSVIDSMFKEYVILVTLDRCFGQGWALSIGFRYSRESDYVIMMDGDLSHPLEIIPELVRELEAGAKVVQCLKIEKGNELRNQIARLFGVITESLFRIPFKSQNTFFRGISTEALNFIVTRRPSFWWYLRLSNREWSELSPTKIVFNSHKRFSGKSKYNLARLFRFALHGIFSTISIKVAAVYLVAFILLLAFIIQKAVVLIIILILAALLLFRLNGFQQKNYMIGERYYELFRGEQTF